MGMEVPDLSSNGRLLGFLGGGPGHLRGEPESPELPTRVKDIRLIDQLKDLGEVEDAQEVQLEKRGAQFGNQAIKFGPGEPPDQGEVLKTTRRT